MFLVSWGADVVFESFVVDNVWKIVYYIFIGGVNT
jgi:hypothetical protein